jgi:LysM repeat protein
MAPQVLPGSKEAGATQISTSRRSVVTTVLALAIAFATGSVAHGQGGSEPYVVQPGDTLTTLAAMAGISVERLVELNGLESADTIFVGDVLILGEPKPPHAIHRVEAGETVTSTRVVWASTSPPSPA